MALAAGLAVAAPGVSLARDRDDHRGGHHEVYRGREGWRNRDWDHDRRGWSLGFGYTAPVPVPVAPAPATGYYDQFGVWHPYNYYPSAPYPNGYYGY